MQLKKKAIEDEIVAKNMQRLQVEQNQNFELKKKHQHTELDCQRMGHNLKFHEEASQRLAQENIELKNANGQLQSQMTQIIGKIQGHFKMGEDNNLISNEEFLLQQQIEKLKMS